MRINVSADMEGICRPAAPGPGSRDGPSARLPGWPLAGGIIAGVTADALLGDPRRGHPVALFGRAAQWLEKRVYTDSRLRGSGYAAACIAAPAGTAWLAGRVGRRRPWLELAIAATAAWTVLGARSLNSEAARIQAALQAGDLPAARAALPSLCGRDPRQLDEKQISRAVIESVAENCGDAIVSPLVWGALGGPAGLWAYRAVNTLDAMVGHPSARYLRFGWASARLDDVANWAPARLTALLTTGCAHPAGGSAAAAFRTAIRYGPRHPSPNAGWCEAAFAGALGIRLGGVSSFDGRTEHRPELGEGRPPEPADIARAIRLARAVAVTAAGVTAALALGLGGGRA